jgi:hypothetical protein
VENDTSKPRRLRRLLTALAAVSVLAAVPAGVAVAGGSDSRGSGDTSSGGSAIEGRSTAPDGQQPDRRDGDRDCPEHRGQDRQESEQL